MEKILQAELDAVAAYARAAGAFTSAGLPDLAKWAVEQAAEEAGHACIVAKWMGLSDVPEGEAEAILEGIVEQEIAVREAYRAELDGDGSADEQDMPAEDAQFLLERLRFQAEAVAEAVGKLVQARYGVFNSGKG